MTFSLLIEQLTPDYSAEFDMRLCLICVLGVCLPGQPHVEEHHQKHNDTRDVLQHGTFIKESNVGRDHLPVDEERCEREGSEGKVDKVVKEEL